MLTRRELMDRAEARLRARGGEEGAIEASRCFLRAMLIGLDDDAGVPEELVARVGEFLKIEADDLTAVPAAARRASTRPPASLSLQAGPGERRRRVLFLGRNDAARVAMTEAVARASLGDEIEIRAASLTPAATDPRAVRALRHAGYSTDGLVARAVTVDDLSWADLVVTLTGDREAWERFLPRSIPHQHEHLDDPVVRARGLEGSQDEDEPFRAALRVIERVVLAMRPPRSSRMPVAPVAPVVRASRPRMPALSPQRTPLVGSFADSTRTPTAPRAPSFDDEPPTSWSPSSGRIRTPK